MCEPECPAEAILPDAEPEAEPWLRLNDKLFRQWPVATEKGPVPEDADSFLNIPGRLKTHMPEIAGFKD